MMQNLKMQISQKTIQTVKGSNISQSNTEAETANIHILPRGAEVKRAYTDAP